MLLIRKYYFVQIPEYNVVSKLMNVFVYIHGGAFMFAAGNEAYPDYLMQDGNVVFVAINYRLGPLGDKNKSKYSQSTGTFDLILKQ